MPIYSRNSASNINVVANENYSYQDMGRILVESAQNDMIMFNAVLRSDFQEQAAITEGTMVASELTAFREASAKEFWNDLKARLQKLWGKIKGVFKAVYAKLTVWLVRNGKAFAAMHRSTLATKPGLKDVKIPMYLKRSANFDKDFIGAVTAGFDEIVKVGKSGQMVSVDATEKQNRLLNKAVPGATTENLPEAFKKYVFEEVKDTTFGALGISVDQLLANISGKSKAIKDLQKASKDADKGIKQAINELNKMAKEHEKETEGSGKNYQEASKACGAYETAVTRLTKLQIKAIKDAVAQDRAVIGKLVAYNGKNESAVLETAAWLEAADEVADAIENGDDEMTEEEIAENPEIIIHIDAKSHNSDED